MSVFDVSFCTAWIQTPQRLPGVCVGQGRTCDTGGTPMWDTDMGQEFIGDFISLLIFTDISLLFFFFFFFFTPGDVSRGRSAQRRLWIPSWLLQPQHEQYCWTVNTRSGNTCTEFCPLRVCSRWWFTDFRSTGCTWKYMFTYVNVNHLDESVC